MEKVDNRLAVVETALNTEKKESSPQSEASSQTKLATKKIAPSEEKSSQSEVRTQGTSSGYIDYSGLQAPSQTARQGGGRYDGMTWQDRIVFDLKNRTRGSSEGVEIPDLTSYTTKLTPTPVSKSDAAQSLYWEQLGRPSKNYEDNIKTLDDMKYTLLKERLSGVDRSFVNPNNINELGKLSAEQKAALLMDLIEIKQNYNAYMNQYGDSVVHWEDAEHSIDSRIDVLVNDAETQTYLSESATAAIRDYITRPENSGMLITLQNAFMEDMAGGKALDREMANGKSFDEALVEYNKELATLTTILPSDFLADKMDIANITLSRRVEEHFMGDGTPGDLSAFSVDGQGHSATLDPVAQAMSLVFMAENANNPNMSLAAIKLNFAQDITRNVDGIMRNMRNGVKFADALIEFQKSMGSKPAPLGVDGDLYKAGLLHAVQTVTMASVLVSRSLEPGKAWKPDEIAGAVASSVQILGMTTEGLAKNIDAAGKPFSMFGTTNGTFGRAVSSVINPKTLESAGKILGAAGGAAMAGLSFYSASRSLKAGEDAKAALEIIGGTASLGSAAVGFTEALLQLTNVIPRLLSPTLATTSEVTAIVQGFVKTGLSTVGLVAGAIGALAGVGLGIYDMVKGVSRLNKMEEKLNDLLAKYTGSYVEFIFRPRL